jgi:hypothetical protein
LSARERGREVPLLARPSRRQAPGSVLACSILFSRVIYQRRNLGLTKLLV